MNSHKFVFYEFSSLILFSMLVCFSCAHILNPYYIQNYCKEVPVETLDLRRHNTGILLSTDREKDFHECTLRLQPGVGYSVVLSVRMYNLAPEDHLTITDSDNFQVALIGNGYFHEEGKVFTSDGVMIIRYMKNNSKLADQQDKPDSRVNFQFTFTQVHEGPCRFDEFQCRNGKCIPKKLACNNWYNHCGDNSNKELCVPEAVNEYPEKIRAKSYSSVWMITIIACSVLVLIIIIVFIVMAVRGKNRKKEKPGSVISPPTVTATVPTAPTAPPVEVQTPPSVFARLRQSFRGIKSSSPPCAEEPKTDNYQVPSMYPQIPPTSQLSGVENPEFKGDDN